MKKYSIIALFVALVVSLSSCNDDFMVTVELTVPHMIKVSWQ